MLFLFGKRFQRFLLEELRNVRWLVGSVLHLVAYKGVWFVSQGEGIFPPLLCNPFELCPWEPCRNVFYYLVSYWHRVKQGGLTNWDGINKPCPRRRGGR